MENEKDTRLPLDEAWEEALADYAQRVAILLGFDEELPILLGTYLMMQGIDLHPKIAEAFNALQNRVREHLNHPTVVAEQKRLYSADKSEPEPVSGTCDCDACRQVYVELGAMLKSILEMN